MSKVKIAQIRKRDGSIVPFDAMKVPVIASSDGIGGEAIRSSPILDGLLRRLVYTERSECAPRNDNSFTVIWYA
jgi:hypothetical protein